MNVVITERKDVSDCLKQTPSSQKIIISNKQSITFPDGIPGFETLKNYILAEVRDYPPFMLMIAEEDRTISLLLLAVEYIYSYHQRLESLYERYCGIYTNGQADYFDTYLILRCDPDNNDITANLKAPIMVERRRRIGKQLILDSEELSCHYPLRSKVE